MKTYHQFTSLILVLVLLGLSLSGCGDGNSSLKDYYKNAVSTATVYVAPRPSAIQRVAVLPFKAPTELIGSSVSDIFTMELLRTERYTLVERGQISGVLGETELALSGLSEEAAIKAGRMLGADAVILGTVDEYGVMASEGRPCPVVGASIRLIDCTSGQVMWSVGHSSRSDDRQATLSGHARAVVLEMMVALVQNWDVQQKDTTAQSPQPLTTTPQPLPRLTQTTPVQTPNAQPHTSTPQNLQPSIASPPPPQAPRELSVSDMGLREVRLTWPKPEENLKYRVERAESAQGPFQEAATVPASQGSYVDGDSGKATLEDAKTYYYRVVAVDKLGQESSPSSPLESLTAPAPDPPKDLKAETPEERAVALSWNASDAEGVVKYLVERQGPQDTSFTQVEETKTSAFKDSGTASMPLAESTKYLYRVRAVNRVGAVGEASTTVEVMTLSLAVSNKESVVTALVDTEKPKQTSTEVVEIKQPTPETQGMIQTIVEPQEQKEPGTIIEETEQPDGTKIKKEVTTTATSDKFGGETTVVTTETTTSNKEGFLQREKKVVTTATTDKDGEDAKVVTTETSTISKDGSSKQEKHTNKTYAKKGGSTAFPSDSGKVGHSKD